jgi:hypothetical protein
MDNNYRSFSDQKDIKIVAEHIEPPQDGHWDDTLKFSHCEGVNVSFSHIYGGSEDAIDMNRECRDVTIYRCNIFTRGAYGVTIKGGTNIVWLQNCIFHGEPKSGYDIDLGNWSDQSDGMTIDVGLEEVTHVTGRPVRVRVLWANRPIIVGGNVKVTRIPLLFVRIYRFFRRLF